MVNRRIGFIGCGNMAKAIIGGMVNSGYASPEEIVASNRSMEKLINIKEMYGIEIADSNAEVAESSHIVFLSVTPDLYPAVIEEIRDVIQDETIIVLIAAGETIAQNEARFQRKVKIVKAMPNTPVEVREGMTSISINQFVTGDEKEDIKALFESFGKAEIIDERLMDIASAVGGSSPAFGYLFIEALADSAALYGMPRDKAYTVAAQALLGSAKMVLETGIHPGQLKDDVCSPGGTTIQSVASLEASGFRSAVIQAVKDNMEKMGSL